MDEVGWSVLFVFIFAGGGLFFSLSNLALRTYSHLKLQEAFRDAGKEEADFNNLLKNIDRLILTCILFKTVAGLGILLMLTRRLYSIKIQH